MTGWTRQFNDAFMRIAGLEGEKTFADTDSWVQKHATANKMYGHYAENKNPHVGRIHV